MFIQTAIEQPYFFVSWVLIIIFSICVHEYAHAQVALWKGDDTAASLGHLTLNPMVQMGLTSIIMLMFLGIAWGAVPVDVRRMRGKTAAAEVAFAGPAANLILCVVFAALQAVSVTLGLSPDISGFMRWAAMANGVLFVFNMLPVPMFDGWTVLALFVPAMNRVDVRRASSLSLMIIVVIWTTGLFDYIWDIGTVIGDSVFRAVLTVLA